MSNSIQAISNSPAIEKWLYSTQEASVLNLFDSSCNLINSEQRVISIVTQEIGNGPLNLVLSEIDFLTNMDISTPVGINDSNIVIGNFTISIKQSTQWQPVPDWAAMQDSQDLLDNYVDIIIEILWDEAPEESFAKLSGEVNSIFIPNDVQEKAQAIIQKLLDSFTRMDLDQIRKSSENLTGLGNSLTPAGDDFLIGVIHALWAVLPVSTTKKVSTAIVQGAASRTTALSAAWLYSAAHGEAGERWHKLFQAIIDDNEKNVLEISRDILQIGYSSGSDALGGFTAALQVLLK